MLVNTKSAEWDILFVNDAWSRVTGAVRAPGRGAPAACCFCGYAAWVASSQHELCLGEPQPR